MAIALGVDVLAKIVSRLSTEHGARGLCIFSACRNWRAAAISLLREARVAYAALEGDADPSDKNVCRLHSYASVGAVYVFIESAAERVASLT